MRPHQTLLLLTCLLAYTCGGATSMLMAAFLPDVIRDLFGPAGEPPTLAGPWLNAAFLGGMTLGGLVVGVLSDRLGRVRMLAVSLLICGLTTLSARWLQDWIALALLRAVAGVGVSGILLICAVLVSEHWKAENTAIVQGVLGVAFPVGIVLSGGLNVLFADWREAFTVLGLFTVALAAPLWLLYRSYNFPPTHTAVARTPVAMLFNPENRPRLFEGTLVYGLVLVGLWAVFSWMPTWVDSLLTDDPRAGQLRGATTMLLGIGGMIGTGLSGFLVNRLGLRPLLLLDFLGTFALCLVLFTTNHQFSNLILVETILFSLFLGVSQGALSVYVTELFPTDIRASGTGFCFNFGRVFTTSAVFFVGTLVAVLGGYSQAMLAFSVAFLLASLVLYRSHNTQSAPASA